MKTMVCILFVLVFVLALLGAKTTQTKAEVTMSLYLVPVVTTNNVRGPKYFASMENPSGIQCAWSAMDYGFLPLMLVNAKNISPTDAAALATYSDVYAWPSNLDQAIPGNDPVRAFLEGVNVPTDWATASSTYRELLRNMAGIFQFNQRYGAISGGQNFLGGSVTLDTRYRDLSTQQQTWFSQTVTSFGYDAGLINQNNTFRQILKSIGDAWALPFYLGGMQF